MAITVAHLSYSIAHREIFSGVTAHFAPGSVVALTGPSGSGKTTLLNILGLLVTPTSGEITIDGVTHAEHWRDGARRRFWHEQASFINQDYGLIDEASIDYNITFNTRSLLMRRRRPKVSVDHVLTTVGLGGRGNDLASLLSGGEKQRVAVARALYKNARYIFADEPTASLDRDNREAIQRLLFERAAAGACVIISTHDEALSALCDQRIDMGQYRGVERSSTVA